jgi:hypothetical protein
MKDDRLTFRNHKGEEFKITREQFRNSARHASDNYSHEVGKSHRPEPHTPIERQFHLVRD